MTTSGSEDRFASVAGRYDRYVGWEPRLQKEMPFLLASIPAGASVLDVGCGTGAHARALAEAGYRVTGCDLSAAMLEQARAGSAGHPIEWVSGDVSDPTILGDRRFDAVLALGNVVPAFGEADAVRRGVEAMIARTAPGGLLVLQYLNGERIRTSGRLVVKGVDGEADGEGRTVWIRHHFEAGGRLFFSSYQLSETGGLWQADGKAREYHDYPRPEMVARLGAAFGAVECFDGLSGAPFSAETSDSLGVRARGRH